MSHKFEKGTTGEQAYDILKKERQDKCAHDFQKRCKKCGKVE
jgi:hypothetical protein